MFGSFRNAVLEARQHGDLYFAALLDRETIMAALGEASSLWQGWIYSPAVTVWVFLSQCLSRDHSCRGAKGDPADARLLVNIVQHCHDRLRP